MPRFRPAPLARALALAALAALPLAAPAGAADDLSTLLVKKGVISQAEASTLGPRVTYNGKNFGFATADGNFSFQPFGYGQMRYTLTQKDGASDQSNFSVQRARLGIKGNAFGKDLAYRLYLNVYSGKGDAPVSLFDMYADYTVNPHLAIQAGQYKVPYAVAWNVSGAELEFVERGSVDAYFRLDRDTGLMAHGNIVKGLDYDLGVFNGEGTNRNNATSTTASTGDNTHHLWVARVSATPLGKFAAHESDIERSATPVVLLVAGAAYDDNVAAHSITSLNSRLTALGRSDLFTWNLFAGLKYKGGEARAEYHRRTLNPVGTGATETAQGVSLQGGCLVARNVEAALRYEYLDPNTGTGGDLTREYGAGLGWFFAGHQSKLQSDLFQVDTQSAGGTVNDHQLRVQYQVMF